MDGLEKLLLPKNKDFEVRGIKDAIKKFLKLTDYTVPYALVDAEFRFIEYLEFIVEFDNIDKSMVGEELIRKAFEPVDDKGRYWMPRILYYNFSASDDVSRFFIALEIMKEIVSKVGLKVVKTDIKNHYSAVIFNYILWKVGADIESVREVVPYGYRTIVTNTQLKTKWKFLDSKYPGFIPLPGRWGEEGDNTVYSADSNKYIYVKFPIFYRSGTFDAEFKLISLVIDKESRKVALFNSNYGAIVFYALSDNITKLQEYIKENQDVVIKPIHPRGKEFFIKVFTKNLKELIQEVKEYIPSECYQDVINSKTIIVISDEVFGKGAYMMWDSFEYKGTGDKLIIGGETKLKECFTDGDKGDWYSNLLHLLDKAFDWGLTELFAGDIMNDPEYYAPTREEYLEDLLSIASEEDLEELRRKGYDV